MKAFNYAGDERTVLTLDAGGTNLSFGAIRGNHELLSTINLPSYPKDLDKCLANIAEGFEHVIKAIKYKPVAISFAFPGPSDYANGVIGDAPNFPAFHGGVALGPYLQSKFGLPVFINNDGDLFAYGEALSGALVDLNREFELCGSPRRYNNLLGITLGTGTGGGVVRNGELFLGDNGAGAEVWDLRSKRPGDCFVEEYASIRAVLRWYKELSGDNNELLTPKDIFEIAEGRRKGDIDAAKTAYERFGEDAGDLIANVISVIDGAVVLGGGLIGASKYFMPAVIRELNGTLNRCGGAGTVPRLESKAYDMSDPAQRRAFFEGAGRTVKVPFSDKEVPYSAGKKVPVMLSKLGTNRAAYLGAYAYALHELDSKK